MTRVGSQPHSKKKKYIYLIKYKVVYDCIIYIYIFIFYFSLSEIIEYIKPCILSHWYWQFLV